MLVLSRLQGQGVVISVPPSKTEQKIRVIVARIPSLVKARLGFTAEPEVTIHRDEVWAKIEQATAK